MNHEIAQVLIYLQAPHVVAKCLKLMTEAKTQEDQIYLPVTTCGRCRSANGRWTSARSISATSPRTTSGRRIRRSWCSGSRTPAGRYDDGSSFPNFMKHIFQEATANLSDAERKELAPLLESIDQASVVNYETKPRPVVKVWKMAEMLPTLDKVDHGRNFDEGPAGVSRLPVHQVPSLRQRGRRGRAGPDGRFEPLRRKDILESILEPSKVVSEQYQNVDRDHEDRQDDRGPAAGGDRRRDS